MYSCRERERERERRRKRRKEKGRRESSRKYINTRGALIITAAKIPKLLKWVWLISKWVWVISKLYGTFGLVDSESITDLRLKMADVFESFVLSP